MAVNRASQFHGAGITVVELVVVAAILATCAAIALPSYRNQVIRVRRSEAMTALAWVQSAEEKHYLRTGSFTSRLSTVSPVDSSARYDLAIAVAADGLSFVATASPRDDGGQINDTQCQAFTIDERGTRGVTGPAGPEACWK